MNTITGTIIALTAAAFFAFALLAFSAPRVAAVFLRGFASSARAHYLELLVRLVVGASLVMHAPSMKWPEVFAGFGWLIVVTTVGLLFVPWQWHRSFAARVIPTVIRFLPGYAVGNVALGALLGYGMLAA